MMMGRRCIDISKGLNPPLSGAPEAAIEPGRDVSSVALLGWDYVG